MSSKVQQALELIQDTKKDVNELLLGTEHVHNLLNINTYFDRIITRLGFMGGTLGQLAEPKAEEFPPITSFMGEKIVIEKPTAVKDLSPDAEEKRRFLEKVNMIWDKLPEMSVELVLNSFTQPGDVTALRGVAKKAGVEEFATHALNEAFIKAIKAGIEVVNKKKATNNKQNKTGTNGGQQPDADKDAIVLTEKMIKEDKEVQALNAEPGDKLVIIQEGPKIIKASESNPK